MLFFCEQEGNKTFARKAIATVANVIIFVINFCEQKFSLSVGTIKKPAFMAVFLLNRHPYFL
ncbi:MAG TPA: hypothetical protein DIC64_05665 [Alphaproteobacteria bacterium]|nr:hypothetical protein [Alphaproteobacteria bacterium]